jgi:hypothetical protein
MEACKALALHQTRSTDYHPTGNADPEHCRRIPTEEGLWRQAWTCPFGLISALDPWITTSPEHYLYSTLGYKPPRPVERDDDNSPSAPFLASW